MDASLRRSRPRCLSLSSAAAVADSAAPTPRQIASPAVASAHLALLVKMVREPPLLAAERDELRVLFESLREW